MAWAEAQARKLHLGSVAGAAVLLLLGLFVFTGGGDAAVRLLIILALVALLGLQVGVFVQDRRAARALEAGWTPPAEPTPAPAEEPARMVIRCKQCGEVFPVQDTGERPLVAACPHCGKSGTIRVRTDAR